MKLTFKLYASLTRYLPDYAENHAAVIEIDETDAIPEIINRYNVPEEEVHLVLLNGVYLQPEERATVRFAEGDTLAIWPPVAGG